MYPYRIRLRGPWECEPLMHQPASDAPLPAKRRMTMPCRWCEGGLGDFAGRVRFRRRFGLPRTIDAHERLWLTFAGIEGIADIWLNGQPLGRRLASPTELALEVTPLLKERNELIAEIEGSNTGGLWGEVALEIRASAYLHGVQARLVRTGPALRLQIDGQAVGSADRPLDLYVLAGGGTVCYATVQPNAEGQPFQLVSEELPLLAAPGEARVELVNGGVVWDGLSCPIPEASQG